MSFEFIRKLPSPTEIKAEFPVPEKTAALKAEREKEIADVITGKSDKFLAIIGPCSADNEDAVLDYTLRLKKVQEKILAMDKRKEICGNCQWNSICEEQKSRWA